MNEHRFLECIVNSIENSRNTNDVYSVVLFGSYVRGDYVKELSDLDILTVIKDRDIVPSLKEIIEKCKEKSNFRNIDWAWCTFDEIKEPMHGYPFKFLTIYLDDFRENHRVIYGKEIVDDLPSKIEGDLVSQRIERLKNLAKNSKGKMLSIVAGEVVRLLAIISGAKGIGKKDVMDSLKNIDDENIRNLAYFVWNSYLHGNILEDKKAKRIIDELMRYIENFL